MSRRVSPMLVQSYHPGPPLSRFVDSFWLYKAGPQSFARERGLPTGIPALTFDLGGGGLHIPDPHHPGCFQQVRGAVLHGASTRCVLVETDRAMWQLGVRFKPGGAHPLFAPPAHELRDAYVPVEQLWGMRAAEICEQLLEATTLAQQFQTLEEALLAQAVRPLERHPAVAFALRAFSAAPQTHMIKQVVAQIALSHVRFIEVFRQEVGLTPKQFCRIRRFLAVLRHTHKEGHAAWAQLALAYGYYDQAHLINDFHALAGVCPSVYLRARHPQFPTYLVLPAD